MKKILTLSVLSMLALPLIAGCGGKKGYVETRTEQEIIDQLLNSAISEVGVEYAKFSAEGLAVGETKLTTTVNQKVWDGDEFGLNYSFAYSLAAQEGYEKPYLAMNEAKDGLVAEIVDSKEIAAHPEYTLANALNGAAYTLSAKVTFTGYAEGFVPPKGLKLATQTPTASTNKSWSALVKCTLNGTIAEIKTGSDDGDNVITRGKIVAAYDWAKDGLYTGMVIADGKDGALLYAGKISDLCFDESGAAIIGKGDYVEVYGLVSPYNGLYEVKPQTIRKLDPVEDAEAIAAIADPVFEEVTVKAINSSAGVAMTGNSVKVSGLKLVASKEDVTLEKELEGLKAGSHWTLTAQDASGEKINIYINYHIGNAAQEAIKTLLSGLGEGTFTFQGMVSAYNKKQLTPLNYGAEGGAAACFIKD